ncbi:MAG: leucine-rich repeat domain-containing protein [Bacteroidaceae bacterium]|nr:leucine-rich repeat domain-containing protein [Bacteroidaceae bacterium]
MNKERNYSISCCGRTRAVRVLLPFLLALCPLWVWADEWTDPETNVVYAYEAGGSEAAVTSSPNVAGDVVIKSKITVDAQDYTVTMIGEYAFSFRRSLTSITIPESVINISGYAFQYCSGLTSITIPSSVTSIGYNAFCGCYGLTSIQVENGNTEYDSRDNCNAIIETATNTLISGCENTVIPSSVTSIGSRAFLGCILTSITIPKSVTSIGSGAFLGCVLTSITIPKSVTSIGDAAFGWCNSLTSIQVESGNTVYDSRDNCNAIIETATNTLIAGFKNTVIPSSVTSIGYNAFYRCGMTSIDIPTSVTRIEKFAFYECGLTSITIPSSVTSIGYGAFECCYDLNSVTIPSSVTSIGDIAFYLCYSLTSVTSYIEEPCNGDIFSEINDACVLYVPAGTRDKYLAAGWTEEVFKGGVVEMGTSNKTYLLQEEVEGITYGLYKIIDNNDVRYNGDSTPWYRGRLLLDVSKGGEEQSYELGDDLYMSGGDDHPSCMLFDRDNRMMVIFVNSKASDEYYGMNGYAFVSSLDDLDFHREVVFESANWGWYPYFVPTATSQPYTVSHFSSAGYYSMRSTRNSDGTWTNNSVGNSSHEQAAEDLANNDRTLVIGGSDVPVNPGSWEQIVMERKYLVHHGGSYNYPKVNFIFDNDDDRRLSICYYNAGWWYASYSYSINGIYILSDEPNSDNHTDNGLYKEWYIAPVILDEWVTEKLIINSDGRVQYYMNDQYMGEERFDALNMQNSTSMVVEISPWGWWTGHYMYMDDFKLTIDGTVIINDDFNDGVINLDSWQAPVNPDGVREEDGIVKMEQLRTDQNFNMYTYPIPLTSNLTDSLVAVTVQIDGFGSLRLADGHELDEEEQTVNVPKGKDVVLTCLPDEGYRLGRLTVGETDVDADPQTGIYVIPAIQTDTLISVIFVEDVEFFVEGGIKYGVYPETKNVKVLPYRYEDEVRIPETVEHGGTTWKVIGLAANAFANNSWLYYVSVPKTVTEAGGDLFKRCTRMAALTWNPEQTPLTQQMVNNRVRNRNMLWFVKERNLMTATPIGNVVVNGRADRVELADDGSEHGFYNPVDFTAGSIQYTHNYKLETTRGHSMGWETISLPFDVDEFYSVTQSSRIYPFGLPETAAEEVEKGTRPFWLYNYDESADGFKVATAIQANTPYIISMPNNEFYQDIYMLAGNVVFRTQREVTVKASDNLNVVTGSKRAFYPCFQTPYMPDAMGINLQGEGYSDKGSIFMLSGRLYDDIQPFAAYFRYIDGSTKEWFSIFEEMADGIGEIKIEKRKEKDEADAVYDLAGRRVKDVRRNGIYIVNGRKVVVK